MSEPAAVHDAPAIAQDSAPEDSIELHGPCSEVERLLRQASPRRLLVRLAAAVVTLVAGAAGGRLVRPWWEVYQALHVPMVHLAGGLVRLAGHPRSPDEPPYHEVILPPYDIDLTEVTVGAYAACVKQRRCTLPQKGGDCTWDRKNAERHPINCVNHRQAVTYCGWAGKRLPSEQEWEYVARGDDDRPFPWGSEPPTRRRLNACGSECALHAMPHGPDMLLVHDEDDGYPATAPVGSFPAGKSSAGALDLEGNVSEWTSSAFCPYLDEPCSPTREYSVRGTSWASRWLRDVNVSARHGIGEHALLGTLGFRCARGSEADRDASSR